MKPSFMLLLAVAAAGCGTTEEQDPTASGSLASRATAPGVTFCQGTAIPHACYGISIRLELDVERGAFRQTTDVTPQPRCWFLEDSFSRSGRLERLEQGRYRLVPLSPEPPLEGAPDEILDLSRPNVRFWGHDVPLRCR